MTLSIPAKHAYLRISIAQAAAGTELTFRKAIQDSLTRTFGASAAGTYVDILHFTAQCPDSSKDKAAEAVIRVSVE